MNSKNIILLSATSLIAISASATTLQCKLGHVVGGRVDKESKVVRVSGDVNVEIKDFEASEGIVGQVRGNTNEKNALGLYLSHAEKDVMAVAASTEPATTVQLYIGKNRYALGCW